MKSTIKELQNANRISMSKKVMMLAIMVLGTATIVNAQTDQEAAAKKDLKTLSKKEEVLQKEKQNVKRELRKLKSNDINENSKAQFIMDFGNITNVKWKKMNGFDEATFTKAGKITTAFYDNNAKLVGTTTIKTYSDIPLDAQKTINKVYKGYTTKEVVLFDDNEANETNMIIYNLPFEDVDSYFVQLNKDNKNIVVQVNMDGNLKYYTELK